MTIDCNITLNEYNINIIPLFFHVYYLFWVKRHIKVSIVSFFFHFFFIRPKKIYMCVYCHMSKKSRVGRSGLIFFFFFFFFIIDKTGNSRSRFRYLIFENSCKMTNYAVFLPSLLSISTKS